MTEEEMQEYINAGNMTAQEQEFKAQMERAKSLRGSGPAQNKRMDWGSQIGRATSGIASAMGDYQSREAQKKVPGMQQDLLGKLADAIRNRKKPVGGVTSAVVTPANAVSAGRERPEDDEYIP